MKREDKYPDTKYFHYYNANPHNRKTGDCVIRAISVGTGESWEDTARGLFELGVKHGYTQICDWTIAKYLESKGFIKMKEPRDFNNRKMSFIDFIEANSDNNLNAVANLGSHHIAVIKDNKVWDIWNSSYCTLHNYWVKP